MIGSVLRRIFGTVNTRFVSEAKSIINHVNDYEHIVSSMSNDAIAEQTNSWKEQIANGAPLDGFLIPAFASVREVANRRLGMRHFDVQIMGGIALHQGAVAEMKTGEGKTLVATLAAYLNALEGKGVHVVTVNDYLATRDADWMGMVYKDLGMSVGCIKHNLDDAERQSAYGADITYGTSNEFGFDYLRDNMKYSRDAMAQRGLRYAIVDEADFVFIDEARTPLIISGATKKSTGIYTKCDAIVSDLPSHLYDCDQNNFSVLLTEEGMEVVERMLSERGLISSGEHLYDVDHITLLHHIHQALRARSLYTCDKDYIVRDGQVVIIDEFTGRMMEGRRYSDGLHQALEAKEGVDIHSENTILASITFQNYFRLYDKLAGMTGTASTEAAELHDIYNLAVREIPANLPVKRVDEDDAVYLKAEDKYRAVVAAVKLAHDKGQPVLIGVSSISDSEHVSKLLKDNALAAHNVLNAKHHEHEAYIIAQAGMKGAITIATNMAGRGTDIQLGGNVEMMMKMHPNFSREEVEERVRIGKQDVLSAGGLLVIGTARHDSRRVDNQLRGRSGRQGDPGRSKFFISLEDDLMRVMGMEKMTRLLSSLGMKSSEAIEHSMVSRSIESAQKKVEERNYGIRKTVVKYDDAVDKQRKIIFQQRNKVIDSKYEIIATFDHIRKNINYLTVNQCLNSIPDPDALPKELDGAFFIIYGIHIDFTECNMDAGFAKRALELADEATKTLFDHKVSKHSIGAVSRVQKHIWLVTLDNLWRDHLLALDFLKNSVSLRAVGQRDPLNEFSMDAFSMFNEMLSAMESAVITRFSHVELDSKPPATAVLSVSGKIVVNGKAFDSMTDALQSVVKDGGSLVVNGGLTISGAGNISAEEKDAEDVNDKLADDNDNELI